MMDLPDLADGLTVRERRLILAAARSGKRGRERPVASALRVLRTAYEQDPAAGFDACFLAALRLAQPDACRYPLFLPHGNWGSLLESPAGAPFLALDLSDAGLAVLSRGRSDKEPFPSEFPHLLCNGAWARTGTVERSDPLYADPASFDDLLAGHASPSGAVTGGRLLAWLPPHNLGEVCAGLLAFVDRPQTSLEELWALVPGPDFPTGGVLQDPDRWRDAYARGVGRVRAAARVVRASPGRWKVVDLPYGLRPEAVARLLARDVEAVRAGDATCRLVVDAASPPDLSLEYQVRMVVERNGKPATMPFVDLFHAFLEGLYRRWGGKRDRKTRVKALLRSWKSRSDRRRTSIGR